jgi:hypothetical protein
MTAARNTLGKFRQQCLRLLTNPISSISISPFFSAARRIDYGERAVSDLPEFRL